MTLGLVDESRATVRGDRTISASRALTTLVWYPSEGGPWPLVVFAHGFEVGPQPYVSLLRSWAASGYVVAAPEFPLTDAAVAGADLDEADLDHQPADVSFVFASLLGRDSPLAGHIDPTRLGVAGHSDGAETALATAADPPVPLGAVVVLSGAPVDAGPAHGVPLLVVHGTDDDVDPLEKGVAVYDEAGPPRFLLTLVGGGHLPPFTGGSPYEDVVDAATVDFLDAYLAGAGAHQAVVDDARPGLATIEADP
jgi:fermentation-respiration switch protein FrsA (DUF1100 family)